MAQHEKDEDERQAAMWATLQKIAGKELDRSLLAAGHNYDVDLTIAGTVDGQPVGRTTHSILSVGHDSKRASSVGPPAEALVGFILSKLNTATRQKLLAELPEAFARAGNRLPPVSVELEEVSRLLLGRLRAKVQQQVKAPISCKYTLS